LHADRRPPGEQAPAAGGASVELLRRQRPPVRRMAAPEFMTWDKGSSHPSAYDHVASQVTRSSRAALRPITDARTTGSDQASTYLRRVSLAGTRRIRT
jgi:hypothetical protein